MLHLLSTSHLLYLLISSSGSNLLLEAKQVDRTLIELRDLQDWLTLLTVKFVELFQIVQVGPRFALHAVEFLNPGLEAKDLL